MNYLFDNKNKGEKENTIKEGIAEQKRIKTEKCNRNTPEENRNLAFISRNRTQCRKSQTIQKLKRTLWFNFKLTIFGC